MNVSSGVECRGLALEELIKHYSSLVGYINLEPVFKASYEPVAVSEDAPEIVRLMAGCAKACGVGPMAAVAGAFSELVGARIVSVGGKDVIVDNGGDIFLKAAKKKVVGIHSGPSALSDEFALVFEPNETPCGVCTSSASVGPSISLGKADSVTCVADSAALADAAASAVGNLVSSDDLKPAFKKAAVIPGLRGVVVIMGETLGAWGRLPKIVRI
ncbi:MAG: UPF0280 family protein [Candidatus Altiarchaeota archaeon]